MLHPYKKRLVCITSDIFYLFDVVACRAHCLCSMIYSRAQQHLSIKCWLNSKMPLVTFILGELQDCSNSKLKATTEPLSLLNSIEAGCPKFSSVKCAKFIFVAKSYSHLNNILYYHLCAMKMENGFKMKY